METRVVCADDLVVANRWREARSVPMLEACYLPETGLCVMDSTGTPIAMAWLYVTNSKLAWFAWPVTRPGLTPKEAQEALEVLHTGIYCAARDLGFKAIMTLSASNGLTRTLCRNGMQVAGEKHEILMMGVS